MKISDEKGLDKCTKMKNISNLEIFSQLRAYIISLSKEKGQLHNTTLKILWHSKKPPNFDTKTFER